MTRYTYAHQLPQILTLFHLMSDVQNVMPDAVQSLSVVQNLMSVVQNLMSDV